MSSKGRGAVAYAFKEPLSVEQVTFGDPGPDEILVKISATGVCHTDLHAVLGDWPLKPKLPFIPGHEGVGVVAKAGQNVRHLKEGDRVGLPWLHSACGECEWCITGWETLCPQAVFGGFTVNGSFAEYELAPAAYAARIPEKLSDVDAAPILCAGVTTWKALKQADVIAGQWVAISGVGGLGQLAVQYAVAMGLHVIAVDVDPQKLQRAREMGAAITLDAREQDVAEAVQSSVDGAHGVIVTAVSLAAFEQAIGMTRRRGTCVLVGLPPGKFPAPLFDVVAKGLTIRGSFVGTRSDLQEALAMASDGRVRSRIRTQPLETVNEALRGLREGNVEGRIVLTM